MFVKSGDRAKVLYFTSFWRRAAPSRTCKWVVHLTTLRCCGRQAQLGGWGACMFLKSGDRAKVLYFTAFGAAQQFNKHVNGAVEGVELGYCVCLLSRVAARKCCILHAFGAARQLNKHANVMVI